MGHTHNFQSSGWGCQILPWSWDSKSRRSESPKEADTRGELAPRTRSWRARMGLWEGDGHHSPSLCIVLPESALLAETRTDWHSATDGRMHLCPESSGNSGRTWDDSWEAKRSTSALPNRSQIWDTVWRFNIHSPGLSFCLDRKSAARFSIPGTWTALKERNLSWDQRRRRRASLSRVRNREPPWRFMWDTTAILSVLTMIWYPPSSGGQ